jgi:hypothetical protein
MGIFFFFFLKFFYTENVLNSWIFITCSVNTACPRTRDVVVKHQIIIIIIIIAFWQICTKSCVCSHLSMCVFPVYMIMKMGIFS